MFCYINGLPLKKKFLLSILSSNIKTAINKNRHFINEISNTDHTFSKEIFFLEFLFHSMAFLNTKYLEFVFKQKVLHFSLFIALKR